MSVGSLLKLLCVGLSHERLCLLVWEGERVGTRVRGYRVKVHETL